MRSIWLVFKNTVSTTLRQRSFWLFTFLMPVVLVGFNVYFSLQDSGLTDNLGGDTAEPAPIELPLVGLVDEGGIIQEIPEGIPPGLFQFYEDPARAAADLETGAIDQYVIIPADYVESGQIEVFDLDFQVLQEGSLGVGFNEQNNWTLPFILSYNLVEDKATAAAIFNPTPGQFANMQPLNPPAAETIEKRAIAEILAIVVPYLFYFILIVVSGYMLQSVTKEKESRTIEILLLSVRPLELMVGKILGLSSVAVIQLAVWLGGGWFLMNRGTALLRCSASTSSRMDS